MNRPPPVADSPRTSELNEVRQLGKHPGASSPAHPERRLLAIRSAAQPLLSSPRRNLGMMSAPGHCTCGGGERVAVQQTNQPGLRGPPTLPVENSPSLGKQR